ncbi:Flp family type IVb pilin [Rhodoplanes roseus]|uniref:Flp family type IVb pilin n=1 Tax=Rhodoplanes roseus TaxID=29409 RepID=A0A327L032_9BRAD|nr:Flp family type IVb pilin [Rhodoplanes roseus]RAI43223.1 hypothetical protein CH341_15360 [Rhodoplanes roseus]
MLGSITRFLRNERGTTAMEYAIIAVGISVTVIAAVNSIGTSMKERYTNVLEQVSGGN